MYFGNETFLFTVLNLFAIKDNPDRFRYAIIYSACLVFIIQNKLKVCSLLILLEETHICKANCIFFFSTESLYQMENAPI